MHPAMAISLGLSSLQWSNGLIVGLEFDRSLRDFEMACPRSTALRRVCLSGSAAQEIAVIKLSELWGEIELASGEPFATARPV